MDSHTAMTTSDPAAPAASAQTAPPKLRVSGWLVLEPPGAAPVEVRRAMPVVGSDGGPMGTVAAVVTAAAPPTVTHLLLGCLCPVPDYRLVPLALIERVGAETVHLRIPSSALCQLSRRTII